MPLSCFRSLRRCLTLIIPSLAGTGTFLITMSAPSGAVSPPALHMTSGTFHAGQRIKLSVGPNHYFTKYLHVNILECADPGGKKSNLPTSAASCDGNTIQGNTVIINKNGSFSTSGYTLYALPSKALDELSDTRPVCNTKNPCVLYVGQNQLDFTAPKLFSHPFTLQKSGDHS
jgi:hypothetical protein